MKYLYGLLLSLTLTPSASLYAQFKAESVKTWQLKNGMKLLVLEDHSIPNANMYTFWKVGSRNEAPGITGLSHFFEHMMFNGSKNYGPGSFDKVMEAAGGSNNAYTTENVTVYTNWFPTSAFSTIADLEADRIASLQFDDKMIESERGVVLSERSTALENDPWELLYQTVRSVAFTAHPYNWPVIGWESDIKAWNKDDLIRYFQTYYNPANAVMVIAGDVKPEEIRSLIQQKFEPISRPPSIPAVRTVEPPQQGERRAFVVKESSSSPQIIVAFHTPQTNHPDYYALSLLSEILTSGPSSRLVKSLVDEKRIAADVSTSINLSLDPDLFMIFATGLEGKDARRLEKVLLDELEKLRTQGVKAEELEKAKNRSLVDFYRRMETINGKAQLLGDYEVFFGGYQKLFQASDLYKAVSLADINRVVKTYFQKQNRTVGVLDKREAGDL